MAFLCQFCVGRWLNYSIFSIPIILVKVFCFSHGNLKESTWLDIPINSHYFHVEHWIIVIYKANGLTSIPGLCRKMTTLTVFLPSLFCGCLCHATNFCMLGFCHMINNFLIYKSMLFEFWMCLFNIHIELLLNLFVFLNFLIVAWNLYYGFIFYRACYGVLRYVMESGAKGCEVCLLELYIFPNMEELKTFLFSFTASEFGCQTTFYASRSLSAESWGHSVQNQWSLRMDIWSLLVSLSRNILTLLWDMFFCDRFATYMFFVCVFLETLFAVSLTCSLVLFCAKNMGFISSFWLSFQGVLGIKVKIMLAWDPHGKQGPTTPLPDLVTIHPPKDEEEYVKPTLIATDIEVPITVA